MKKHNFDSKCSLCDVEKDKYTAVLSSTHNYILCLEIYILKIKLIKFYF